MWKCKHCKVTFNFTTVSEKGNHSRWCQSNPKLSEYRNKSSATIASITKQKFGEVENFEVECSVCRTVFIVRERERLFPLRSKYYCSRSCANSIGGRAKSEKYHSDNRNYRVIGFRHHDKKCVVCGEHRIVAIHHYNENHLDNSPENLIPLCPTHHQYMHSRYRSLIDDAVRAYIDKFRNGLA